jgi:hypothetical protein
MIDCVGCKRQQMGTDALCLSCIEDLNLWLRSIPDLYAELGSVRLPGSVRVSGPSSKSCSTGSAAPVRLEVIDLLDRGEVFKRLEPWSFGATVREMCDRLRHQLLSIAIWDREDASAFYRQMKGLCRDIGRAVGEPQEAAPVGKCSRPFDEGLCRGQLHRAAAGGVYCRRCGDKPTLAEQKVWVTAKEAALITGKPIETIRTWFKRGQVGWSTPFVLGIGWLPIIVRRAATTLPHSSDSVNHGSAAELSAGLTTGRGNDGQRFDVGSPARGAHGSSNTADLNGSAPEHGPQYPSGETDPSTAAEPPNTPSGAAGYGEKGPAADRLSAAGPPS